MNGSRSLRIMGFGNEEYRLITRGSTYFFCLLIIVAFFLKVDVTRMYLLIAYPLGLFLLLVERWLIRQGLVRSRTRGRALTRVMIISDVTTGQHLYKNLEGVIASGLSPAAFYLPGLLRVPLLLVHRFRCLVTALLRLTLWMLSARTIFTWLLLRMVTT